uniref:Histone-lysine N-methyltransferase n=1 Tax=Clastoptera arizonana TaxID=38151 RepID=A0A1B6CWU1_9HEMI
MEKKTDKNKNGEAKNTNLLISEVIDIDDDDDDCSRKRQKKKSVVLCMNCGSDDSSDLVQPPNFALSFYETKKIKGQKLCSKCFTEIEDHYMELSNICKDNKPLLSSYSFPQKKEIIFLDSDDEDVPDEGGKLCEETQSFINKHLERMIDEACSKYNLQLHIEDSTSQLTKKLDNIIDSQEDISECFKKLEAQKDEVRKQIYDMFRQPIKELEPIEIDNSSDDEISVIPYNVDYNLPKGPLVRPKIKTGDIVYVMDGNSYRSMWIQAKVIEITSKTDSFGAPIPRSYTVEPLNLTNRNQKSVSGKFIAYLLQSSVQIPVGTRVIAPHKKSDVEFNSENFFSGITAEVPHPLNKYRYLIFFDDYHPQYVRHENIRLVCESSKEVWLDMSPETRKFIEYYLTQYPERPMVKLQRSQYVKIACNEKWVLSRVLEVDASLVKVIVDSDSRLEWIYRGSHRLEPLYKEIKAAKERQQSGTLSRSRGFGAAVANNNQPYVEYTRAEEVEVCDDSEDEVQFIPNRSVARKSTAKKQQEKIAANENILKPPAHRLPKKKTKMTKLNHPDYPNEYVSHECNSKCVKPYKKCKELNPLAIPLQHGFRRYQYTLRYRKYTLYVTPCGRRIRSIAEMYQFLLITETELTIDFFEFEPYVSCLKEFETEGFVSIEDISKGHENMKISCINELDHTIPPNVEYMTERHPYEGVNLNTDKEFLVGCDCEDGCQDKEKCSCWQMTFEGAKYCTYGPPNLEGFGYQYRRLHERVATGIYECNPMCKCKSTCLNRVAQQPLTTKLQLFKTVKKGWGIRSMCDIPKGAFICIYAGFLLTDQQANEGGKNYGDEYLAELDYIEVVENIKEDYEHEVPPELLETDSSEPTSSTSSTNQSDAEESEEANVDFDSQDSFKRIGSDDDFVRNLTEVDSYSGNIKKRLRKRSSRFINSDDDSNSRGSGISNGSKCDKCNKDFLNPKDKIKCTGKCKKTFHTACSSVKSLKKLSKLGAKKSSWVCSNCKQEEQGKRKSNAIQDSGEPKPKYPSVREFFGEDEYVYIMDAKTNGNIGRYLNHSCDPNVFVQNVFVDTHDLRFPWVSFFALNAIEAGDELTWDYNYDVGSVPGKILHCYCKSAQCRGRLL